MSETEIRIAKRVATYMLEVAEQQVDLSFFTGIGLCLAIVYEEITGNAAGNRKPQELMQWALDLPWVKFPHVS
jgi:hypothetical protein